MTQLTKWIMLALVIGWLSGCAEQPILSAPRDPLVDERAGTVLSEPASVYLPTDKTHCTSGDDGIGGTGCSID